MPQLDIYSFSSQLFWCLITFSTVYIVLLRKVLPNIAKILKIRNRLINNYSDILTSLKKEKQENSINNMYSNIIVDYKNMLNSTVKSYDSHTETLSNNDLSLLLKIIKTIKL